MPIKPSLAVFTPVNGATRYIRRWCSCGQLDQALHAIFFQARARPPEVRRQPERRRRGERRRQDASPPPPAPLPHRPRRAPPGVAAVEKSAGEEHRRAGEN